MRRALKLRAVVVVICGLCALVDAHAAGAQGDPASALIARAGWSALAAGQAHAAADAFREALAADPKNAQLYLGAGMAASLERRDSDAKEAFEHALSIDPALTQARALLGQIQRRMGDFEGAIHTYELLVSEAPSAPGVKDSLATLERWRREAELHGHMQQAVGSHFTVSFAGPEEAVLAAAALDSLDAAYWRIGQIFGTYPSDPVSVVLYSTEQFHDITRSPSWAAGGYDGIIRVPMRGALEDRKELDRVLAHELTHAIVRTLAVRGVPTWLNEGLATALETGDVEWAEPIVRENGRQGRPFPLRALQTGFGRLQGDQARTAYAISALAVRRLLSEAGGFAVANLLRDLGEGADFDAAFLHRIQRSFADFQATLY
jgi:tetratricopeptide (TPR) repeat protein